MIEKTLTAIPDDKYKNVRPDWAFFIYFSVMYLFYMNTIIQLAIQLFILAYVVIRKIFPSGIVRLKKDTIKNIIFFVVWFGGLTLLFFLSSRLWAYSHLEDSRTMMGVFRCFGIGLGMFLYVDSSEKALSVLQSFAYASFIMGIAALLTTSPSQYFQAGDEGFGQAIGQQRNGRNFTTHNEGSRVNSIRENSNASLSTMRHISLTVSSSGAKSRLITVLIRRTSSISGFTIFDSSENTISTSTLGCLDHTASKDKSKKSK